MPNPELLDDEAIEAILRGRRPTAPACVAGTQDTTFDSLIEFSRDVRTVADRPVPRPNASLAAVLSAGFSTDKGDLLVTAASNVTGPATTQVAGLPKWRKNHSMFPTTGLLSGLLAKIVAGVTAALAGLTAAGAAGALPDPAQHAVATVINSVSPFNLPDGDGSATVSTNIGTNPTNPSVDVHVGTNTAGTGSTGTGANVGASTAGAQASANAGTNAPAGKANASASASSPIPGIPGLPGLPNLNNLPLPVPQCVKDIVDLKTGQPKVPLNQIATQVVACVKSLMAMSTTQLPTGANQCVSSLLGIIGSIGANPGSVPNISGLDVSTCVPVDVTKCMSSVLGLIQGFKSGTGFGFGFGGNAGTGGAGSSASAGASSGIPGLSGLNLEGCMPFSLDTCLKSLFSMAGNLPGVPTGGIPGLGSGNLPSVGNLDLSACVPVGSLPTIPGMGNLSSFLPR